jgi:hypothetical protein
MAREGITVMKEKVRWEEREKEGRRKQNKKKETSVS